MKDTISSYLGKAYLLIAIYYIGEGLGWTWNCVEDKCIRSKEPSISESGSFETLDMCRLTCGTYGSLWPRPTGMVYLMKELMVIRLDEIQLKITEPVEEKAPDNFTQLVNEMFKVIIQDLKKMCGKTCAGAADSKLLVKLSIKNTETNLTWFTKESYSLEIKAEGPITTANIQAETAYGARHGLQTLSQLMTVVLNSNTSFIMMVKHAFVTDAPVYCHRGLLIDTARHFLSMETIKRTLDGMGHSKLNVLHWHATDADSFPLKLPSVPEMARYGAYSNEKTYSVDNIRELVSYGQKRGVRIIMEIEIPGHSGQGWQWGPAAGLGELALCMDESEFSDGHPRSVLDPRNENIYKILEKIYRDLLRVLPKGEILHQGGDESIAECWKERDIVNRDYVYNKRAPRGKMYGYVLSNFRHRAKDVLDSVSGNNNPTILWRNINIDHFMFPYSRDKFVIQAYSVPDAENLLGSGYKTIVSTEDRWYLNYGFHTDRPYKRWNIIYDHEIPSPSRGVYGGEVCMWGEHADDNAIDAKIWPRTAAFAERVWSNPSTRTTSVTYRLQQQRRRLIQLGIEADAIVPEWCKGNEGMCE